ncbi:MAG: formate dehydrogenase accessory sulfurtransferase FdhD [Archaeoglobaceae archaeon]|nr:formate dehydrogenase accessory sulfurtransferase FdhD [Archaeoglobaceae archaeon]MCX8151989.1 formate dehydrogenase accessory sulfurtransferase FdhD [Archaeoglobaceae archaeon]MDW8013378.1 formate dehydrogenase accessory sulfurtransferase FdhD [Archaeoglobaceae archaeon]
MIVKIGEVLEVANESQLTIFINDRPYKISCTPKDLEDLIVGFIVSEGFANFGNFKYSIKHKEVRVEVPTVEVEEKKKVKANRTFTVSEVREKLNLLDIEEYKRTRGYHVAAVVGEKVYLRYDVGRHNAVDKAIGASLRNYEDLSKTFLILSGRISREIAMKCVRSGIPLVASKAAIIDSALEVCRETGLSAISFTTGIAYVGEALRIQLQSN